jgi:hypothetical protein
MNNHTTLLRMYLRMIVLDMICMGRWGLLPRMGSRDQLRGILKLRIVRVRESTSCQSALEMVIVFTEFIWVEARILWKLAYSCTVSTVSFNVFLEKRGSAWCFLVYERYLGVVVNG